MSAGLDLEPAREVFRVAQEVLGWDVRAVCLRGPEATLSSTEVSQPAILTSSVAAARALEACGVLPDLVAGHSVGEFAALVVARAISLEDALRVVSVRGRAMATAGRLTPGAMSAVIGLPRKVLEGVCAEAPGVVVVATINAPDQVVISGHTAAVAAASERAKTAGARRIIALKVSVAAHSPLMEPAAAAVRRALDETTLTSSVVPFVSGVTGAVMDGLRAISTSLVRAITGPIDWPACVAALQANGASAYVEVGPGAVLSGLLRRIVPDASVTQVFDDAAARRVAGSVPSGVTS